LAAGKRCPTRYHESTEQDRTERVGEVSEHAHQSVNTRAAAIHQCLQHPLIDEFDSLDQLEHRLSRVRRNNLRREHA
jgi:hypothetical protein